MCAGTKIIQIKDFKHANKNDYVSNASLLFYVNSVDVATRDKFQRLGSKEDTLKLASHELFSKHT